MSHLDEGTLHALLDGELELHEVREIQAHLGSCSACDSRLQAAKDVYAESDRLVASIQYPGRAREEVPEPAVEAEQAQPPRRRERGFEAHPLPQDAPPQVVILPEENTWPERRRRFMTAARWAAVLFVAVGAGYIASEVRTTAPKGAAATRDFLESESPAWITPEEVSAPEGETLAAGSSAASESAPGTPAAVPEARKAAAARPAPAPAPAPAREAPPPEPKPVLADQAAEGGVAAGITEDDEGVSADEDPEPTVPPEDVRREAAEALAELDRQRRVERAAAATADIDRSRRQAVAAPQPAAPPAPRTLEQRSGIYLRIGLDEAARQLGRPVHVIEGLGSQFMGLVQGRQSAGADASRPVVRVVYQDSQGRMILLDQQRIRPGQTWPSAATQWTIGEIGVHLHGEVSGDVLQNLRPRVR